MTLQEFDSPDRVSRVAERTAELARQKGKDAETKARSFLAPYIETGLVNRQTVALIMDDKRRIAEARFTAERAEGEHNDVRSMSVGLTALITEHAKWRLEQLMDSRQVPQDMNAPIFTEFSRGESPEDTIFQMHLPHGSYDTTLRGLIVIDMFSGLTNGTIDFFTETQQDGDSAVVPGGSNLDCASGSVIRIEGTVGELWQNPGYTPEGQQTGRYQFSVDGL